MNTKRRTWRQTLILLGLLDLFLLAPAQVLQVRANIIVIAAPTRVANLMQAVRRYAAEGVYFDYPDNWAVTQDRSIPQLPGLVLTRAGLDARLTVYVAPNEISAPADTVPALLDAARTSVLLPMIEQVISPLEARGAQVQRTRATTEIGGVAAQGDRWLVSAANETGNVEAYLLNLQNHLVIVVLYHPAQAAGQVAPVWEMLRRTLSIGAPRAQPETTPTPSATATPATAANLPSTSTIEQATKLLNESYALTQQVVKLRSEGKFGEAIPLAERALALAEQFDKIEMPPEMKIPMVPGALNVLGELNRAAGNYERAETIFRRSLALTEQLKGTDDPSLAAPLNNLATLYYETGNYAKAVPLFERSYNIIVKVKGAEHQDAATALNNVALLYEELNDFKRAEETMLRALAIREKVLGKEHRDVAVSLSNLGGLYDELGDHTRAEQAYRRALAIQEKSLGADHHETATTVGNLALMYEHKGDTLQAEKLFRRSLAAAEKALGANHPDVAATLDNLGNMYFARGDYANAEAMYKRALSIFEKSYGEDSPDAAKPLNNLALLYREQGNHAQAEALLQRALAIFEKKFGREHLNVATALDNLAHVYHSQQQYERAAPLFARALAIREKLAGPESAEVAVSLNNTGSLTEAQGDGARALELYRRALRIYEKIYGPNHPNLSLILTNISSDYYALGDMPHAVEELTRASEIRERQLALLLGTGSEEQKRLFVATMVEENDYTTSLHAQAAPNNAQALRLALTTILRRKGRVLDAMSDQIGALRRHLKPEDRALLEQLSVARAALAALVLNGPGKSSPAEYQERLTKFSAEVERLEVQVGARSAEYRAQVQPVTLESIQRALPQGAALVEFSLYHPYNPKGKTRAERFGAPRYVAYVLTSAGAPAWVELGEAAPIEQAITAWRATLANPRRADVKQLARTLDERVMRPVRKLVGGARHLFISPDSALNKIPFGALVDEENRYLVETYSMTYLTSGRDLLRLQIKTEQKQGAVVFADPSFDAAGAAAATTTIAASDTNPARRSFDFTNAHFTRLPGTAEEARALGTIMPGLKMLTGAQASEAALKEVSGPAILHVATHGFFLPAQESQTTANDNAARGLSLGAATKPKSGENPLLRSGLALAGANARQSAGGEDGVLTALEAAGLDLWGTKMVVLSACETGLGDVTNGDGVYGLRRALVLAGSESQVMSLWQVSDAATRDLMTEYYRRLQAGEGRTEALRQVQLGMLKGESQGTVAGGGAQQRGLSGTTNAPRTQAEERSHPFYWASFIQSGEWRGLDAKASR
ncbi:MAG TPA: CHAT domain-containing tetratricopeptide repeat protein [Pyrinomonadaceae bacterium]|nr:CHAT domain-containing tetratricopeptide repeat protein [Pyrinomonadaceae bacterium]